MADNQPSRALPGLTAHQAAGHECARPGCPCDGQDLAYADGETVITVDGIQLRACLPAPVGNSAIDQAAAAFTALGQLRRTTDSAEVAGFVDELVAQMERAEDPLGVLATARDALAQAGGALR